MLTYKTRLKNKKTNKVLEFISTLVFALAVAVIFRSFLFSPYKIPTGSMLPTLEIGDYLFVSKYDYGYSKYSFPFGVINFKERFLKKKVTRGDVVVFALPKDDKVMYIKRVIGLPGDIIQVKKGRLYINNKLVHREEVEDYINIDKNGFRTKYKTYKEILPNNIEHIVLEKEGDKGYKDNTEVYKVPEGHYFMMGDNRDNSQDSRFLDKVGYVPYKNVVGKARIVFFSINGTIFNIFKLPFNIRYKRLFNSIK